MTKASNLNLGIWVKFANAEQYAKYIISKILITCLDELKTW